MQVTIDTLVDTVNKNIINANNEGYPSHAEYVFSQCESVSTKKIMNMLFSNAAIINRDIPAPMLDFNISINDALDVLFKAIFDTFGYTVDYDGNICTVYNDCYDPIGQYQLIFTNGYTSFFELSDICIVNVNCSSSDKLSRHDTLMLFHETFHAIHHIICDLNSVSIDQVELGGVYGEYICSKYLPMVTRTHDELKRQLAIAIVDIMLAAHDSIITAQHIIKIVEMIQSLCGVNLTLSDFFQMQEGYAGLMWVYPYSRNKINSSNNNLIKGFLK